MDLKKTVVFAIAAVFCICSLSVIAGSNASAEELEFKEGDAYGQVFELNMKTLEPILKDYLGLDEGDDLLGSIGSMLIDMMEFEESDVFYLDELNIQKLDFSLIIASLTEVVKANDDGCSVDYAAGIGFTAAVAVEVGGMLPKAGTYDLENDPEASDLEKRNFGFSADVAFGFYAYGTVELTPDGVIKSVSINVDVFASATIRTGITFELTYGTEPGADPEKITLNYKDSRYEASADLHFTSGWVFALDEIEKKYTVSIDDLNVTGKISINNELKALIDMMVGEENYVDDNIMNMEAGGFKILVDGELKLNDIISTMDLNTMIDTINGPLTIRYDEDEDLVLTEYMNLYNMLMASLDEYVSGLGLDDLLNDLKPAELDAAQLEEVKNALNDVRSNGNGNSSGGSNLLLYAGAVALIAVIGVAAFFIFRGRA